MTNARDTNPAAVPASPAPRNPWDVIAQVLRTPHGSPLAAGSASGALLVARALAFLGLCEPASGWAHAAMRLGDDGAARALIDQIRDRPGGRLEPSEAQARVRNGLARAPRLASALGRVLNDQTETAIRTWSEDPGTADGGDTALFAAGDGTVLRLPVFTSTERCGELLSDPARARGWLARAVPPRTLSAGVVLPVCEPRAEGLPPDPVIVLGMRSPWLLARLDDALPAHALGAAARLHVIEPDVAGVFDAVAMSTEPERLNNERIDWSLGEGACAHAEAHWRERMGYWSGLGAVADPGVASVHADRLVAWFERARACARDAQRAELARLRRWAGTIDRDRDDAWYADRWGRIRAGAASPNVLVLTTRFTSYVQHAARDLRDAFAALGGRCALMIEPDAGCAINTLGILGAIERADPDLVVTINYPRSTMAGLLPRSLPLVTWVQDAMPHLFGPEVARDLGARDVLVGSIFNAMVTEHGVPASRCLRGPVPASAAKFTRGAGRRADARWDCDVLIASNHGETPRATAERLEREVAASGGPAGLVGTIAERLWDATPAWRTGHMFNLLRDVVRGAMDERGLSTEPVDVDEAASKIASPLLQRWTRHRLVSLAGEVCDRRGWTLALHGRGWEDAPEFARYAKGPLAHHDLPQAYANAAVTLHASPDWPLHQRVFECLLAGGLPAVMLKPDDPAYVLNLVRRALEDLCDGHLHDGLMDAVVPRRDGDGLVFAIDHPVGARALALAQRWLGRLGRGPDAAGCPTEAPLLDGCYRAAQDPRDPIRARGVAETASPASIVALLDALEPAMFVDAAQLEAVVERARMDGSWRAGVVEAARGVTCRAFTYEHAVERIAAFVADLCVGEQSPAATLGGGVEASPSPTVPVHAA